MPTITEQAICIRQWDFSETSQTVSLFGRDTGIFRGIAKGSRRPKSNFSGGLDLLTLGDVVSIIKPGRDLATITEWGLHKVWWRIRRDAGANRVAYFMAECSSRMFNQHDPHPGVFDALVGALDQLESGSNHDMVLTRFLWTLLVDSGFKPELQVSPEKIDPNTQTILFSPREGGVVDGPEVPGRWRVRVSTLSTLDLLIQGDLSNEMDPLSANRAAKLLAAYIREILGSEPTTLGLVFPDLAGGRV
jgi:DNA repair protein RecO (recombination protein O)